MINQALAAFTQAERGKKNKKSISATLQRAKLTICSSISTSSSRVHSVSCSHPSGGCLCWMYFVFFQQQLHLHSGFDTFTATAAAFFRFSMLILIFCSQCIILQLPSMYSNANIQLLYHVVASKCYFPRVLLKTSSHVTWRSFLVMMLQNLNPLSRLSLRELQVCLYEHGRGVWLKLWTG